MIAVSDTGTGMDKEIQEKIFDPFFSTKEIGKGTGLGLSTVYGIVKQSGGNIFVESEVGNGSTFKIYFPRIDEAGSDKIKNENLTPKRQKGVETILLVEDEESVRKISAAFLRSNGYTVIETCDGVEALKRLKEHDGSIDLLLTDVVMPNMGGRDLMEALQKTHPHLPTLFMSGYTADAIAYHRVLDEGLAFLPKPFSPTDLSHAVRKLLDAEKAIENE